MTDYCAVFFFRGRLAPGRLAGAGSSLGSVINDMGGGMIKPVLMAVVGVLLLLFGHVLNLVLCVLSVVVHGIRLNMLEFSSHLGMEWSGIKYDPFRVTVKSER